MIPAQATDQCIGYKTAQQPRNDQSLRDFVSIDCRRYGDRVIDTLNLTSPSA